MGKKDSALRTALSFAEKVAEGTYEYLEGFEIGGDAEKVIAEIKEALGEKPGGTKNAQLHGN